MKKINLTILAATLMFFFTLAVGCAQTGTDTMGAGNMESSMESMSGDTMDKSTNKDMDKMDGGNMDKDIDKGMDTMSSEKMDESMDKGMDTMDAGKMDGSMKKDMQDNMK